MDELLKLLYNRSFWLVNIGVAIVCNVVAYYIVKGLEASQGRYSRARVEKNSARAALIARMAANPVTLAEAQYREVRARFTALQALLFGILATTSLGPWEIYGLGIGDLTALIWATISLLVFLILSRKASRLAKTIKQAMQQRDERLSASLNTS